MSWGIAERWSGAISRSDRSRPLILRIAVVGSAVAGALSLVFATLRGQPDLFTAAGVAVLVMAAVYVARPRAGTVGLLALGTAICVGCTIVLLADGTLPWLLAGFWGGAATLLAGLLDLIGRDATDQMVAVTVAAVVSLLLLSAIGLADYVRVNWTAQERSQLERVLRLATARATLRSGSVAYRLSQASGGAWSGRTVMRTRDPRASWRALALAIQQDGWSVDSQRPLTELRCRKDGFTLVLRATEPEAVAVGGPGKYQTAAGDYVAMNLALSLQADETTPQR